MLETMTYSEFMASLQAGLDLPPDCSAALQAMWYAKRQNWSQAHQIAQDLPTPEGSWVHAYLHRTEGDEFNANYWYSRSNHPSPKIGLDEEWEQIVKTLLS